MKKKIVYTIFCLILLFIGNNVYAETNCDKYACATCIYGDSNSTYTYEIKADGNGSVTVDFTHKTEYPSITATNNVSNSYFINSNTNKIECYPIKSSTTASGRSVKVTLDSKNGTTELTSKSTSTNNDKFITEEKLTSISCDFTSASVTCTVTATDSKMTGSCTGGYTFSNSEITLSDFGYGTKCPKASLVCSSRGGNYCTLAKPGTGGGSQEGNESETGSDINDPESVAEYTCNYIGKINGENLKILKLEKEWKIIYPNGTTLEVETDKVGSHLFPSSNCEDIFYTKDKKIVKAVDNNSSYRDIYIAQFCKNYEDLEQYCQDGTCKIQDALCGNSIDNESQYGECPSELKPIIVFLKKVVFNTIQFMVPILLILMGSIDLVRAVIASDDKAMKDAMSKFIKRLLTAGLLFFVTLIVTVAMDLLADVPNINDATGWKACWHNID